MNWVYLAKQPKRSEEVDVYRTLTRVLTVGTVAAAILGFALVGCSSEKSGEQLVKSECDRCHSLDRVSNSGNKTQADWESTVKIMQAHGLRITDAERGRIVEYLVEQGAK